MRAIHANPTRATDLTVLTYQHAGTESDFNGA